MSVLEIHPISSSNPCKSQHLRAAELPLRQNYAQVGIGQVKGEGGGMYAPPFPSHPQLCLCHASLQKISRVLLSWFNLAPFGNVKQAGDSEGEKVLGVLER